MAVVVAAVAFSLFAALGTAHLLGVLDSVDERVALTMAGAPDALDPLISVASAAGSVPLLAVAALIAAAVLFRSQLDRDATLVVAALIGCGIATGVAKLAFDAARTRKDTVVELEWLAFPSGHVSIAVAVYGSLGLIVWSRARRAGVRAAVAAAVVLVVAAIGASRLTLGAHYLSDVLAGLAIGVGSLTACVALLAYVRALNLRALARRMHLAP